MARNHQAFHGGLAQVRITDAWRRRALAESAMTSLILKRASASRSSGSG
jgi:hypothetical protein